MKPHRQPSSEILERLAHNTIMHRFRRKLTQKKLAMRCGWTPEYINRVELGLVKITLARLEILAFFLFCSEADLLRERKPNERYIAEGRDDVIDLLARRNRLSA